MSAMRKRAAHSALLGLALVLGLSLLAAPASGFALGGQRGELLSGNDTSSELGPPPPEGSRQELFPSVRRFLVVQAWKMRITFWPPPLPALEPTELMWWFVFAVIQLVLMVMLAVYYEQNRAWPKPGDSAPEGAAVPLDEWSSDVCECWNDREACCWACWCPAIRWADNMSATKTLNYWAAFVVCAAPVLIIFGLYCILLWLPAVLVMTWYRQRFRAAFGIKAFQAGTIANDCWQYCCCIPCAISQEIRHLQKASESGHPALLPEAEKQV